MPSDVISLYLAELEASEEQAAINSPPVRIQRTLHAYVGPAQSLPERMPLAEARLLLIKSMQDYIRDGAPGTQLLLKAPAGTGKTHVAVQVAESVAMQGGTVLYLAPRRAMYAEMLALSKRPELWQQWDGRQAADPEKNKRETCRHAEPITQWMQRGWPAMQFCSKICGWDYIKDGCPFHAQKRDAKPIIVGTHPHLVLGHPIKHFDLIIGDEYPLNEFLHDWQIPGTAIAPMGIDDPDLALLLADLARLASSGGSFSGPELIKLLGGPDRILAACQATQALADAPPIYKPSEIERVPYNHLEPLVKLMDREARLVRKGADYPHRLLLNGGNLHLLLRRAVNEAFASTKIIWLDATADVDLYERVTGWSCHVVKPEIERQATVMQVWDSTNNKGSIISDGVATEKLGRIQHQISHIIRQNEYKRPAIISYMALQDEFAMAAKFLHFHGNRGTNELINEDFTIDALFVVGTPNVNPLAVERMARMLFWERDTPFQLTTFEQLVPYSGHDAAIPVSGYWSDPDMQAVHAQLRDAELIQAAYRARPLTQSVDIWLLTSHPVADLAPDMLISIREMFQAPPGVDPYVWAQVVALADDAYSNERGISPHDIEQALDCSRQSANRYVDLLIEKQPDRWERGIVPRVAGERGKPRKAASPRYS